ncbi:MAG: methylamine utilization protein, partial [Phycisphaeraceae bacterium]|nr:methylamine utilization protein [Phycisphaeraceae bacterium]
MSRRPFRRTAILTTSVTALTLATVGCDRSRPSEAEKEGVVAVSLGLDPDVQRRAMASSPLPVPPADPTNRWADDREAAALGRRMFFDSRLSADGSVSCATCHQPERRFTDGLPLSRGIGTAARHAPSLVDAAHHRWFNWDGRSDSMWAHAIRPIENPLEMGGDRTAVVRTVLEDSELRSEYETIFGPLELVAESLPARARPQGDDASTDAWGSMSDEDRRAVGEVVANLGKAMAAYQRTLRSEPSRFDAWVEDVSSGGDGSAHLDASELRGMSLFFGRAECWECHSGAFF